MWPQGLDRRRWTEGLLVHPSRDVSGHTEDVQRVAIHLRKWWGLVPMFLVLKFLINYYYYFLEESGSFYKELSGVRAVV